jgi:hypothetical protein
LRRRHALAIRQTINEAHFQNKIKVFFTILVVFLFFLCCLFPIVEISSSFSFPDHDVRPGHYNSCVWVRLPLYFGEEASRNLSIWGKSAESRYTAPLALRDWSWTQFAKRYYEMQIVFTMCDKVVLGLGATNLLLLLLPVSEFWSFYIYYMYFNFLINLTTFFVFI